MALGKKLDQNLYFNHEGKCLTYHEEFIKHINEFEIGDWICEILDPRRDQLINLEYNYNVDEEKIIKLCETHGININSDLMRCGIIDIEKLATKNCNRRHKFEVRALQYNELLRKQEQ